MKQVRPERADLWFLLCVLHEPEAGTLVFLAINAVEEHCFRPCEEREVIVELPVDDQFLARFAVLCHSDDEIAISFEMLPDTRLHPSSPLSVIRPEYSTSLPGCQMMAVRLPEW